MDEDNSRKDESQLVKGLSLTLSLEQAAKVLEVGELIVELQQRDKSQQYINLISRAWFFNHDVIGKVLSLGEIYAQYEKLVRLCNEVPSIYDIDNFDETRNPVAWDISLTLKDRQIFINRLALAYQNNRKFRKRTKDLLYSVLQDCLVKSKEDVKYEEN